MIHGRFAALFYTERKKDFAPEKTEEKSFLFIIFSVRKRKGERETNALLAEYEGVAF